MCRRLIVVIYIHNYLISACSHNDCVHKLAIQLYATCLPNKLCMCKLMTCVKQKVLQRAQNLTSPFIVLAVFITSCLQDSFLAKNAVLVCVREISQCFASLAWDVDDFCILKNCRAWLILVSTVPKQRTYSIHLLYMVSG